MWFLGFPTKILIFGYFFSHSHSYSWIWYSVLSTKYPRRMQPKDPKKILNQLRIYFKVLHLRGVSVTPRTETKQPRGPFINDVMQKTRFLNPLSPSVTKFSYNFFSFVWKCHTASDPLTPKNWTIFMSTTPNLKLFQSTITKFP